MLIWLYVLPCTTRTTRQAYRTARSDPAATVQAAQRSLLGGKRNKDTHAEFDPKVLRRMGTKEEIALRAQDVLGQIADRTRPIKVRDVEEMVHTITNNIITKKQRTK